MLNIGELLYKIYNQFDETPSGSKEREKVFSDLHIKKKNLVRELSYCEFLAGTTQPKWQKYYDATGNINDVTVDSVIRFITAETNWYRLFMIRLKRLFTNIMPLIKSLNYQWFVQEINLINPVLSYVAWLFYVPRLSADLYSLFIHTCPGPWMGEHEKAVPMIERLNLHWERLWFEILNDAVWLAVGLACCFFLSPANSILLTAGLYFFDAGMAYSNNYFSTRHHKKLLASLIVQEKSLEETIKSYTEDTSAQQGVFDFSEMKDELASIQEYKEYVNLWIEYERQKLILSMFVTTMFSISMSIGALPTLFTLGAALTIACPIISAVIVVSVCLIQYAYSEYIIPKTCPQTNILKLKALDTHIKEHEAEHKKRVSAQESLDKEPQDSLVAPSEDIAYQAVRRVNSSNASNDNSFFSSLKRTDSCPKVLHATVMEKQDESFTMRPLSENNGRTVTFN